MSISLIPDAVLGEFRRVGMRQKNRILMQNAPRPAREFLVEGRNTGRGGGGREAARSAAGDAGNAKVRLRLVAFAQFSDDFLAILERFFKP